MYAAPKDEITKRHQYLTSLVDNILYKEKYANNTNIAARAYILASMLYLRAHSENINKVTRNKAVIVLKLFLMQVRAKMTMKEYGRNEDR